MTAALLALTAFAACGTHRDAERVATVAAALTLQGSVRDAEGNGIQGVTVELRFRDRCPNTPPGDKVNRHGCSKGKKRR